MVSIQNPSVTVKDIWEYANRTVSNSQEIADLNADVLLNSLVAQNPNPDTVASRIRNGIVNEILGNKDKYTITTHYANFYEPNSLHESPITWFMGVIPNSTSYKVNLDWFLNSGMELKDCVPSKCNLWKFNDDRSHLRDERYTGMLTQKELGILEYVPPEKTIVLGSLSVTDQGASAPDPAEPLKVESSVFDLSTLPADWHYNDTYFPANSWGPSSNLTQLIKSNGGYMVNLILRPVNDFTIQVNNVSGDYFTNMQISLYEPCNQDLEFELTSGQQSITTLTIKAGELIGKALQDVNVATVPGQTTATLRCISNIPSDITVPGYRRFEVSNLIPVTPTPTGE